MKAISIDVMSKLFLTTFLVVTITSGMSYAQTNLKGRIDSLFIIASSGEVQHRDQNEPAMDAIAAFGAAAVPYLIDKFTTKSARERWTIIWTLKRIGSAAVPDLVEALRGDDPLVVGRVAWALGDIKDSSATEPLINICGHADWQVRNRAITALGKIGDRAGAEAVMGALGDLVGQVRKSSAVSSGRLGMNDAVAILVGMLGDNFYGARMTALEALLKLDTPSVIATLSDSIESSNRLIGFLGCEYFSRLATDQSHDLLLTLTHSTDAALRAHAAVALVRSDPSDNCGFLPAFLASEKDRFTILKVQSAVITANRDAN